MAFWNWNKSKMEPHNPQDESNAHRSDHADHAEEGDLGEGSRSGPQSDAAAAEIESLRAQLDEATAQRLRLMADYQNYQRRSKTNEAVQYAEGMARVVMGVVGVVDHFDLALMQDPAKANAQQILDGVKVIRAELLKVLSSSGVGFITPSSNDPFEPGKHEAVMQQSIEGIDPGNIAMVLQPGYAIQMVTGERVLRAAKVSVAPTS
jgi:molecular chaperone GrpE